MSAKNTKFLWNKTFWKNPPGTILKYIIFGHPLRNSLQKKEKLGFILGLPLLAIDALSSVTYATEEILIALLAGSTSLYGFCLPIVGMIIILLSVLTLSYTQTIQAYPEGGGAYIIAKEHLGKWASLVAAASLLIDYILTVAVSVTAGVRAIVSSYPHLLPHSASLSIIGIFSLTWLNLRGLKSSARTIAPFVYFFIFIMLILGFKGFLSLSTSSLLTSFSEESHSSSFNFLLDLALLPIILRAFAGGCTAMTGIEAIANAGSMLEKPSSVTAQRILWALSGLLAVMFMSVTLLSYQLGLKPLVQESLLSQIVRYFWGSGIGHTLFQILTAIVLFLAANTAFAGAPKLSAMLAQDNWMPKQLYHIGDRLVFSEGILALAVIASSLVFIFQGQTHSLIPLYAVGVFSAFTLSQTGMSIYWYKQWYCQKAQIKSFMKMCMNGFGAFLTFLVLFVTFEAKFREGAFLVFIAVPIIIFLCHFIQKHYQFISTHLQLDSAPIEHCTYEIHHKTSRSVVVPLSSLHRGNIEAIAFACEMFKDVHILLVNINSQKNVKTKAEIEKLHWGVKVTILSSPYRSLVAPIIEYIHQLDQEHQKLTVLILPEIVPLHWWQMILHNKSSQAIIKALAWSEKIERQSRIIINVPYYIEKE